MKKLSLLLIVIAGATQLRAQQTAIKPFDQNLFKAPKGLHLQQFKPDDSTLLKGFSTLPKGEFLAVTPYKLADYNMNTANSVMNIDRMPIARMNGNIDHMPIAKVSGDIDKMPGSVIIVPKPATP